jgi:hypothetical protein
LFYSIRGQKHHTTPAAYFPTGVAQSEDVALSGLGVDSPNGTFGKLALNLASDHACQKPKIHERELNFPLAVFMPGEGTTRLWYSQIASTIASNGYIVVTIDSPYNVDVVECPDGSLVFLNKIVWETLDNTALARTAYVGIQS